MMGFAVRSTHPTCTLLRECRSPRDVNPATVGAYCICPFYRVCFIRAYAIRPYEFLAAKASRFRLAKLSITADKEPLVCTSVLKVVR